MKQKVRSQRTPQGRAPLHEGPKRQSPIVLGRRKIATVFFISHFDERSHFMYRAFEESLQEVSKHSDRKIELLRVDNTSPAENLLAAIKKGLNSSVLAICDITPSGPVNQPEWNPNVFYELGMAEQLGLPTYLACAKGKQPTEKGLPFDIVTRNVTFYDFTPDGLEILKKKFSQWLLREFDKGIGRVSAFEQSQYFVRAAREIKNTMYEWHGPLAASFRQLLARMVKPLEIQATKMTTFLSETQRQIYRFQPPGRSDAVEQLFIAMIESLEPGDEYLTLSTIPFWKSFNEEGKAFREACMRAAERGVSIHRLLIVPDDCSADENRMIQEHSKEARSVLLGTYELRIKSVPRAAAQSPHGHVGVCKRKELGVTTAFQPDYEASHVVAIQVRSDAEFAAREFEERWNQSA